MKREWVTLAFGILLVGGIAAVSVWQNLPFWRQGAPAVPIAQNTAPADDVRQVTAEAPARPAPAEPAATGPVRLDASVSVVHKHRFGSCEGTLRAVPGTLTYTTTHRDDAFRMTMADVEEFDLEGDRPSLRIHKRAGRTWNFEPRGESPTSLVAFHREVERARRGR
jgi:hypothetical protein